ncbi:endonuclease YncB(thermonuclease family) [Humibacillus xanthopallidus]|uniref:Endonuclease YncB(Thermonuclease family) n=1 Tax=Humibacillus xanthopallidus TaxID=412689 RepID=A0A543PNG0_9MICO|nr:thermonuclease family protein [Humibacillus xanthopallidus]TQN45628.1 endonuclease YncB(thermonuclease family) [Humibacillus xanthopallidus]
MPSRKATTNAVLIAVAGLVLAGTVATAQGDGPAGAASSPASTTVWVDAGGAASSSSGGPTSDGDAAAREAEAAAAAAAAARADAEAKAADATEAAAAKAADAKAKKAAADKKAAAARTWAVTKVVDGDTIWVSRDGVSQKVRLVGIDTPETGQCGFTESTRNLRGIIGGQRVTLTAGARDDVDRYGRLLRYVDVNGVDAGLRQIKQGFAVARYDSRDGYGRHARETAYVRADAASPRAACAQPGTGGSTGGTSGGSLAGSAGAWPLAGDQHPCPRSLPVKGNESSMIAHEPGDRYYKVTNPEQCFATMSDAEAAGFRPAKV